MSLRRPISQSWSELCNCVSPLCHPPPPPGPTQPPPIHPTSPRLRAMGNLSTRVGDSRWGRDVLVYVRSFLLPVLGHERAVLFLFLTSRVKFRSLTAHRKRGRPCVQAWPGPLSIQGADSRELTPGYIPFSLQWQAEDWGPCSATCGGGAQQRRVLCKQTADDRLVANSHCEGESDPPESLQLCNQARTAPLYPCDVRHASGTEWCSKQRDICLRQLQPPREPAKNKEYMASRKGLMITGECS